MPFDKKRYPDNWSTEIRPRILTRAQHCCEFCGIPEYAIGYRVGDWFCAYEVYEKYGQANERRYALMVEHDRKLIVVRITIAHLDHDEWNHNVADNRLAALCERCHLNYDRVDNNKRKLYGKEYKRYQLELI